MSSTIDMLTAMKAALDGSSDATVDIQALHAKMPNDKDLIALRPGFWDGKSFLREEYEQSLHLLNSVEWVVDQGFKGKALTQLTSEIEPALDAISSPDSRVAVPAQILKDTKIVEADGRNNDFNKDLMVENLPTAHDMIGKIAGLERTASAAEEARVASIAIVEHLSTEVAILEQDRSKMIAQISKKGAELATAIKRKRAAERSMSDMHLEHGTLRGQFEELQRWSKWLEAGKPVIATWSTHLYLGMHYSTEAAVRLGWQTSSHLRQ